MALKIKCPECGEVGRVVKYGTRWSGRHKLQMYLDQACGKVFSERELPDAIVDAQQTAKVPVLATKRTPKGQVEFKALLAEKAGELQSIYDEHGAETAEQYFHQFIKEYEATKQPKKKGRWPKRAPKMGVCAKCGVIGEFIAAGKDSRQGRPMWKCKACGHRTIEVKEVQNEVQESINKSGQPDRDAILQR